MRILDSLLPTISRHYGTSIGTASGAVSAYALSYGGLQLISGRLGDRFGLYRVVSWAVALSAVASLLCMLAPSLEWLVLSRFLAGGIAAAIGPLALAWVGHTAAAAERPTMVARLSSSSIIGVAADQVGGGLFGSLSTWRVSLLCVAVLFATAAVVLISAGVRRRDVLLIGKARDPEDFGAGIRDRLRRSMVRSTITLVSVEGLAAYMSLTYIPSLIQKPFGISVLMSSLAMSLFAVGEISFAIFARRITKSCPTSARASIGGSLAALGIGLIALVRRRALRVAACL